MFKYKHINVNLTYSYQDLIETKVVVISFYEVKTNIKHNSLPSVNEQKSKKIQLHLDKIQGEKKFIFHE